MELANANLSAAYAPFEGYGAPLAAALAPAPTDEFPPEGDEEVAADDLFALPYGDPALQASPWVDKTDAAGERTHAGASFNLSHLHEELARTCFSADGPRASLR